MNINDIYMGSSWTFDIITGKIDTVVRLEPQNMGVSLFYKKEDKYNDLLNDKILESPNHRIIKSFIFANANEVKKNQEYVLPEYLMCFKEIAKLFKWNIKEEITRKKLLQIIKSDEFLSKCLKEEVRNEKSI